jgi:hypothetical protein
MPSFLLGKTEKGREVGEDAYCERRDYMRERWAHE